MTTAPDISPPVLALTRPALSLLEPTTPAADLVEFDDALRRAGARLRRYAERRLRDPHEAEEVVQEALLRAFQHRAQLVTEDDLNAWLTVVTGRLVIDRLRVRGRSTPVAELPPNARAARDTAEVVVARDEARIALDALEAMPSRQAAVLWAREVEGLSYDEIGERFAMSEPSVRSVLHRARRTLRREYAGRGGTLPAVGLVALAPWLRGMRHAARLREVARRGASAAAVAATGLAVATVVPFGANQPPAHAAPAMTPAIGVRAAHATPARHVRARPAAPAVTAARPTVPDKPAVTSSSTPLPLPAACGRRGYGVGCGTHTGQTLYVGLPVPVAGQRWVGISTNRIDCTTIPTTPIAQCDSSRRGS